ncbi:SDR family oxidoreductase [Legionella sp. CNM-1927-20]|uniref:SDR family oxidoreductase n=1 Tax=Legionella sp. CNM-1927-20 TaxID=3422221 RepID=UPI00403AACC3
MSKNIIVTGATGGIGKTLSHFLFKREYQLTLLSRDKIKLFHLQNELQNTSSKSIDVHTIDFANLISIENYINLLGPPQPKFNGVVIITPKPLTSASFLPFSYEWQELFNTCFIGPMELIRLILPFLNKSAKIVILSGIASVQYMPGKPLYSVLRKMWLAQAKALAYELGPKGIRVNSISPGGVMTEQGIKNMQEKAIEKNLSFEEQYRESTSNVPLRKYASPEEIAVIIEFFLSDSSNHITGTNLVCDGGFNRGF